MRQLELAVLGFCLLALGCQHGGLPAQPGGDVVDAPRDTPIDVDLPNDVAETETPRTPMAKALWGLLGHLPDEEEGVRDGMRESLLDSDHELRRYAGGNRRKMIEQANRKVASPVIGGAVERSGAVRRPTMPRQLRAIQKPIEVVPKLPVSQPPVLPPKREGLQV